MVQHTISLFQLYLPISIQIHKLAIQLNSHSVNAGFIGERGLWNIEIAADPENDKSKINTLYLEMVEDQNLGSQYMHFNK